MQCDVCRGLGATYAKGWLIMVGASRTSPVPGSGIRRRHERRRTLPRFGALLGDNTPSPAPRGLRMITKGTSDTKLLLELYARGRRRQGLLSSLPRCWSNSHTLESFAWVPWGVYIGLPPRGTMVIRLGAGPAVSQEAGDQRE